MEGVVPPALRALIIDDQREVRVAVRDALFESGVTDVVEASSGLAALALVKSAERPFDVILCDLQMPDRDGVEVLRDLSALGVRAAVIIMSVEDYRVIEIAGTLASLQGLYMLGTVQKPVLPDVLSQMLSQISSPAARDDAAIVPLSPEAFAEAFSTDDLVLHYQPQLDRATRQLLGAEALVRWNHATRGLMYPSEFMPEVERSDEVAAALTRFALAEAIAFAGRMQRRGLAIAVSINLFARDFEQLDLPDRIARLAQDAGVPPDHITLEITETDVVGNMVRMADVALRLHLKGFRLSVDDFGTGESGLAQLKNAPFSELKIDKEFIDGCSDSTLKRSVTYTCVGLAGRLGMATVAEGVQNQRDIHTLEELGCDRFQGFFFARPMSEGDFIVWASEWPAP